MKKCTYCGRENEDDVPHCAGCGTSEFVSPNSVSAIPRAEEEELSKQDLLVRDRPKLLIVAGVWLIYGSGFVGNILVLFAVLTGRISGIRGFFCFWLSISSGAFCAYLLRRVVKNYTIHKKRATDESVV